MRPQQPRLQSFDMTRDDRAFYLYKRIQFLHPTEYVLFQLDWGFNYILREIREVHDETGGREALNPPIYIQALQTGSTIQYHVDPVPIFQMVTPGPSGCDYYVEANPYPPGVATGFGINFTAVPAKISKLDWGYIWPYRDAIQLQITGQTIVSTTDPTQNSPSYCDIMLIGRYYHQDDLGVWKGGNQ